MHKFGRFIHWCTATILISAAGFAGFFGNSGWGNVFCVLVSMNFAAWVIISMNDIARKIVAAAGQPVPFWFSSSIYTALGIAAIYYGFITMGVFLILTECIKLSIFQLNNKD